MNRSFENIFVKYNVTCDLPRKRGKHLNTLSHRKSQLYLDIVSASTKEKNKSKSFASTVPNKINSTSTSSYFNMNSKGKYHIPTRYKTLHIVSGTKHHNSSIAQCSLFSEDKTFCGGEENCNAQVAAKFTCKKTLNTSINSIDDALTNVDTSSGGSTDDSTNESLLNCFEMSKSQQIGINHIYDKCLPYEQKNISSIQKSKTVESSIDKQTKLMCSALNNSDNFLTEVSETKSNYTLTVDPVDNVPTELDLLLDLIKQEELHTSKVRKEKFLNCDNYLPRTKSSLKGGYEELFQKALKTEKAKSGFLKYDKKIGLRTGHLLTVVNIQVSYGVTLATVRSEHLNQDFGIIVAPGMMARLKIGTQIEAFFDDKILPYKLKVNGEWIDVYLEPYKILIS